MSRRSPAAWRPGVSISYIREAAGTDVASLVAAVADVRAASSSRRQLTVSGICTCARFLGAFILGTATNTSRSIT